jgi:hypothetical protein
MITDLSPLLHKTTPLVRSDELQLQKGSWVKFSPLWPDDQKTGWASGNTFVVSQDTILVDYPWSGNIVNQDYAVLDLTNQTNPTIPGVPHPTAAQMGTLQMYPTNPCILYQISVGMKRGKNFVQLQIPRGTVPIYQLGSSAITPNIADPVYRYLGAKYPKDSPVDSPTWFLYSILNAPQIVLLVFMDGGDTEAGGVLYGKATIDFKVNKATLSEITLGSMAVINIPVPSKTQVSIPSGQVAVVTGGPSGDTSLIGPNQQTVRLAAGQSSVVSSGWIVNTASGSAVLTTMDDVRKWRTIQERALYIPFYTELTGN